MKMASLLSFSLIALLFWAALSPAVAQPLSLDQLWPNDDGLRWSYEFDWTYLNFDGPGTIHESGPASLTLNGVIGLPGGMGQVLEHQMSLAPTKLPGAPALNGLDRFLWRARPDLRPQLRARAKAVKDGFWAPFMLHGGYLAKRATYIEMWQDGLLKPTWRYLEDDLTVGAQFTFQLVPDFADDVFLYGTVGSLTETIATAAGLYVGVRMDYEIDTGIGTITNESGEEIGTVHGTITGVVIYVPDVGPVYSHEEHVPVVWADCSPNPCGPEITDIVGVVVDEMTLSLRVTPVANDTHSWGAVKAAFEQ